MAKSPINLGMSSLTTQLLYIILLDEIKLLALQIIMAKGKNLNLTILLTEQKQSLYAFEGYLILFCIRGCLNWVLGKIYSPQGLSSIGVGCPGKWWSQHSLRYLKDM